MKMKYVLALIISNIALGTVVEAKTIKVPGGPNVQNECIQKCKEIGKQFEKHTCRTFYGAGNCTCYCK